MILIKYKRIVKETPINIFNFGVRFSVSKIKCILNDDSLVTVQRKNEAILRYLEKKFEKLIQKYHKFKKTPSTDSNLPIWVMWWDGEMPDVIKLCHKSQLFAAGDHPIKLITKYNVQEFVEFPDIVWKQFDEGKLRIQHLADMIRVQLIRRYGGLWLDASIFCNGIISENVFKLPIFSIKGNCLPFFVSENKWTTFVIGGQANNILCSFLDDFFIEYAKTSKPFIDYYMFDCAIALAYRNIQTIREDLDNLPLFEQDIYWLNENLYSDHNTTDIKQIPLFSKLAWRKFTENIPPEHSLYNILLQKYS